MYRYYCCSPSTSQQGKTYTFEGWEIGSDFRGSYPKPFIINVNVQGNLRVSCHRRGAVYVEDLLNGNSVVDWKAVRAAPQDPEPRLRVTLPVGQYLVTIKENMCQRWIMTL